MRRRPQLFEFFRGDVLHRPNQHGDAAIFACRSKSSEELEAVDSRHEEVENDRDRSAAADGTQSRLGSSETGRLIPKSLERCGHELERSGVVVNNPNLACGIGRNSGPS